MTSIQGTTAKKMSTATKNPFARGKQGSSIGNSTKTNVFAKPPVHKKLCVPPPSVDDGVKSPLKFAMRTSGEKHALLSPSPDESTSRKRFKGDEKTSTPIRTPLSKGNATGKGDITTPQAKPRAVQVTPQGP